MKSLSVKSASRTDLIFVFARSYLNPEIHINVFPEKIEKEPKKAITIKDSQNISLFQDIEKKLKNIGDRFVILSQELSTKGNLAFSSLEDGFLKAQTVFLASIGFYPIQVEFGCFKNWGYNKPLNQKVFSLLIGAQKNVSPSGQNLAKELESLT